MPHSDMRGTQNKARVAEAVRGTYPIWNRFSRKENHVDLVRKIQEGVVPLESCEPGEIVIISK